MSQLSKFLVESILLEADSINKVVVVYSGRFQPFHKGHYATYDNLVRKFGKDSVYIGTSNVTDSKKSPFNFKEKKTIMTNMFGIPSNKIVNIRNPYAPEEILNKYDEDTTGFITVVGEKDSSRLSGKYFTAYKGKVTEPYLDRGYVYASPSTANPISGTDVRYWLSAGSEAERKKNFTKAYPKFDEQIFKLITLKLKKLKECINEEITLNVNVGDTLLMGKFKNKKVLVKNIGKDEWGMPTINGKKAVTFRIPKKEELKEMGLPGGAGVGLSLPGGYINGAPKADDVKKVSKKLNNKGMSGYEKIDEDNIPGGLAKGKTLIDLAKKYDEKGYYDPKQFAAEYIKPKLMKGIKVEMEHTTDVRIATEIAMDHLWEDINYYEKLASIEGDSIAEAISPQVYREFMQACSDAGLNSFQIIGLHVLVYILTLGATGLTILSALGIAQLAKDAKDTFNNWNAGRKLNPQKVKEIVKDFENKVNKLEGGRKRFFQGIINKMKKTNPEDKSSLVSINKDLKYYADRYNLDNESVNESILLEGGAYGHMNHPFDIEMNLTFSDLKNIVTKALNGDLETAREKTDGQALAISWVNGRLVAARNKSHLKNGGVGAMTIGQVADKFAGRGGLTDAYNFAMQDLSKAISGLSDSQRKMVFKNGTCFMNLEVIYPTSVNVIPYGQPLLVFHGTFEYDKEGTVVGENQQAARILAGMIKQVNAHVQSKYTIQGPPMQSLPKSDDLSSRQGKYFSMISKLQSEFGLKDSDGVADYHQAWWMNFVDKNAKKLDAQQKIGLVKRWAFGNKSFRIADIKDDKLRAWAEQIDKQDQQKISKQNLMRFEEIFLGVGADVLSFMTSVLTANPDSAKKQMVSRLQSTITQVKGSGDPKKIAKLKLELQRLNALGGFDKIVPNEGIVFVYGGNTYKLTGAFAPLNQILGIFFDK